MEVTGIIHTKNSAETLERLLDSISWLEEKIVVDMGSTDKTVEIAKRHQATVYSIDDAPRVDGVRNKYLEKGSAEWVFVLDSDEYLSDDSENAVKSLIRDSGEEFDAFAIPRYNEIAGQVMRGSGWYPDQQIRLFRKGAVRWSDSTHQPPEVVTGNERLCRLEPPNCLHIHHYNYPDLSDFISRQAQYALKDQYDVTSFCFERYVAEAYEQFALRSEGQQGDDLAYALATVMAWDRIIRGVIHWDRSGRTEPFARAFSLPISTSPYSSGVAAQAELRKRNQELEAQLEAVRNGVLWKISDRFEKRLPMLKSLLRSCLSFRGRKA